MRGSAGSMAGRLLAVLSVAVAIATVIGMTAQASSGTGSAVAKAAGRIHLVEVAHLKFSGEKGASLVERGQATGTYNAPVWAEVTLRAKKVTAVVTIYPRGGSITGTAVASFTEVGTLYYFGGLFTIRHGTGKYRHTSEVAGKALGFSGIFNHKTLNADEVKTNGEAIVNS
jgi:hypothetical protein